MRTRLQQKVPARSFESLLEDGSVGCSLSQPGDNQGTSPGWCHPCPKPSSLGTAQLRPFFLIAHFPAPHPGVPAGWAGGHRGHRQGVGVTCPVLGPATLGQRHWEIPANATWARDLVSPALGGLGWRSGAWDSLGSSAGAPGVCETLAPLGKGLGTDQLPRDAPRTFPGWLWRPGVVLVVVAAVPSSRCVPGPL